MSNKKVPQDIIELEHYFNKYFDAHIAPLADKAVKDADAAYLKEYQQMVNDSGVFSSLTVTGPGSLQPRWQGLRVSTPTSIIGAISRRASRSVLSHHRISRQTSGILLMPIRKP